MTTLPLDLMALLLEAACLPMIAAVEKYTERAIRIVDIRRDSDGRDPKALDLLVVHRTQRWPLRLSQTDGDHNVLDALLDLWLVEPRPLARFSLPAAIRLGTTRLTMALVNSLRPDDIVLLQTMRPDGVMFVFAEALIAKASKSAAGWILDERPKSAGNAASTWIAAAGHPRGANDAGTRTLGEIPVLITFDLIRQDMALQEHARLSAGSMITGCEESIWIGADGLQIGHGAQVSIEGCVGVRVTHLFGNT